MSATGKNYVVDDFTTVYDDPIMAPGTVVEAEGYEYRFIQCGDTDTATAGTPLSMDATDSWKGCYDLSDGSAILGVVMTTLETGEYGFVMRSGIYNTCTVQDAAALGGALVASADGGFRCATAGELLPTSGVSMEVVAQAATSVAVYVQGV